MMKNNLDWNHSSANAHFCHWSAMVREAADWVFFAAAFGILFNLYDSDGIELKTRSTSPTTYQNNVSAAPLTYAGFKPGKSVVTPIARDSDIPLLSLQGSRFRYGKALFVDARPAEDYKQGHIAGAIPFDVNDYERAAPKAFPLLPRDKEIVAYCSGGDCDDSLVLAQKLKRLGYPNVKLYEGGYFEWMKAGLPVKQGETP
jgi:rhodanese-related sulfurtransferase